ncbi:MAG: hypothetical protein MR545_02975, partial [Veillonellaceae bacterium]|nr:hypothetical protein [Veillonellaceae bacterium]
TRWTDIVAIAAGYEHTVGLKADGTCVATAFKVTGWTDIFAIDAGERHTLGLKTDGTCVATGDNYHGQCNVKGWTDIVAIAAGWSHTVGLKADGTCVATGDNYYGQCNVTGWVLATYDKKGLLIALQPLNFLNKSRVTGFNIAGIEPANTSRHVAFKVDDVWNKLTISSGTASLTALETQEITADSLIAEGNTVAELQSVTDCTPFVGKLVYPAVALYADSSAEVMPTFGMTVNALIDTTVNVYSFTDYSQEYAISDGDDVSIISLVAETELKGNGKVDITARIKSNGEWSEYMSLNAVQMKQASAIQLKAVYTVQNTDGSDSAKITGVVIKYNTAGAVTSNSTTEIVTVTQKFTNDLTYVHAYCKHKELIDAKINAYCSIRKQPQKRVQYQVGNGTGALKTYTLPDSGVNQDTLAVYVDGKFISDFGYNTETSEITLTADKDAVVSASYEYGWEMSDWIPMEQGGSQINDSGNYTTEYTYTIPSHDGAFTVTAVKFELARPEGHVDNETIGTGTGRRQMIRLPHIARKETIVCNGKWSYDYDNQRLTIIAPENEPIVISYDWIAESPKVYSIAAGWAD